MVKSARLFAVQAQARAPIPVAVLTPETMADLRLEPGMRAIAVHGGTILARNRRSGGLEMTVTIPAARLDVA